MSVMRRINGRSMSSYLFVLALLVPGCARTTGGVSSSREPDSPGDRARGEHVAVESTPSTTAQGPAAGPPELVVEVWDVGIPMLRVAPFPLFAAWSDGMVVRRVDDRSMRGQVPADRIVALADAVDAAGFFDPPMEHGLVFPDGPMQVIRARSRGRERVLRHYGREDASLRQHIDGIGPDAVPSRQDAERFVRMWAQVLAAVDAVTLPSVEEYDGSRTLTFPQ